jgi:hypothetical protein
MNLSWLMAVKLGVHLPLEYNGSPSIGSIASGLTANQSHRLVELFGAYALDGGSPKPRRSFRPTNTVGVIRLLTAASQLLDEWPSGFHRFWGKRLAGSKAGFGGLRARLGYLYVALYRDLAEPEFAFIREAFEQFIKEEWSGVLSARNSRFSAELLGSHTYVPAPKAMSIYGVNRGDLFRWVESGSLGGIIREHPSGKKSLAIAASDLERIPHLDSDAELGEAAALLSLPERRVVDLCLGGLLKSRPPSPGGRWRISRDDIRMLIDRLERAARDSPLVNSYVSVHSVLRHFLSGQYAFASLVEAVASGQLPCRIMTSPDSPISFSAFEVGSVALRDWLRPADGFRTVQEVALSLHVKQEVAYHLVRRGIIGSEAGGRKGRIVPEQALSAFSATYIFARDAAKLLDLSSKALMSVATAAGIRPVCAPALDGCRQVLYVTSDLARLPGLEISASGSLKVRIAGRP